MELETKTQKKARKFPGAMPKAIPETQNLSAELSLNAEFKRRIYTRSFGAVGAELIIVSSTFFPDVAPLVQPFFKSYTRTHRDDYLFISQVYN